MVPVRLRQRQVLKVAPQAWLQADRAVVARAGGIVVVPVRVRQRQALQVAAQAWLQADRAAAIAAAPLV